MGVLGACDENVLTLGSGYGCTALTSLNTTEFCIFQRANRISVKL